MIFENVQEILKEKNITVTAFEDAIKIARGSFYKWRLHSPSIDKIKAAAEFLGVTVNDLVK